jgi:hypothetical protein
MAMLLKGTMGSSMSGVLRKNVQFKKNCKEQF